MHNFKKITIFSQANLILILQHLQKFFLYIGNLNQKEININETFFKYIRVRSNEFLLQSVFEGGWALVTYLFVK